MKTIQAIVGIGAVVWATSLRATPSLFEFGVNQDGAITGVVPAGSVFDESTGLGTVQMTFTGVGLHSGLLFVDHDFSKDANSFFNELGAVSGTPSAGQSWEIDEPGFLFGNIFDHFQLNTLDNSIGTPDLDDVSMAMGWNFALAAGETGSISFLLSETQPSGFYLRHYDPESQENVYFSSSLTIRGEEQKVPDQGSTAVLLLIAAAGLSWVKRTIQNG